MTFGLVHITYGLPEWQAVKQTREESIHTRREEASDLEAYI